MHESILTGTADRVTLPTDEVGLPTDEVGFLPGRGRDPRLARMFGWAYHAAGRASLLAVPNRSPLLETWWARWTCNA